MFWLLLGCGGARKGDIPSASESLHRAIALYDDEDYLKAEEEFSAITLNFPGSIVVDSAEYYLGETHFQLREYILAAASYQRVVEQYPRSPLVPVSQYKIGLCYYNLSPIHALDQEYTKKAIEEFQKFLEDYPGHEYHEEGGRFLFDCREKLAKKEYTSGVLYFKLSEFTSAIIYFDGILDNYYDTKYAPLALYYKGEALKKDDRFEEADEVFRMFLSKYPDHTYRLRVENRLSELEDTMSKVEMQDE
jgi:outer membrane protein assembly factor BamD